MRLGLWTTWRPPCPRGTRRKVTTTGIVVITTKGLTGGGSGVTQPASPPSSQAPGPRI